MNKLKKFFIILIILFLMFCLFLGIRTIINYRTLHFILNKQIEYIDKENYSLKSIFKSGEDTVETMAYYRKGIGRQVAENGVYSWTDGKDAYMIDEENKTVYVLDISKSSESLVSSDKFAYLIPGYNQSFSEQFKMCGNLFNSIKTETVGEEECYKITIQEDKYLKTVWVIKRNCLPLKATMEFPSGEIFEYSYVFKFDSTKVTNIEMPDIDSYKVVDYETNEVIVDKFVTDDTNTVVEDNNTDDN